MLHNHTQRPETGKAKPERRRLALLPFAALGVVYGDIGTSPLYALRECFHGDYAVEISRGNILGVLSLMFWSLMIVVTTKYLTFIMRADNKGEGGIMALTALVMNTLRKSSHSRWILIGVGLFAASLLYGDGMITPAISVLSAVQGLRVIAPGLDPYVIPATVLILVALFLFQRKGTAGIGALFGPVMVIWFVVMGVLGIVSLTGTPEILSAFNPWYGIRFIGENRLGGFLVLGSVFLVVTGTEALYADLGHFGRRPIRLAWSTVVLPALLCNYFGQGALLLRNPQQAHHPFYALAPHWMLIPLVLLATAATVIASQAVITGAFSLTRQAIQLGFLPRLRTIHTSEERIGQIYIPQVNWILMISTILLVLGFRSASHLAAAYGVAVSTTMLITTCFFYVVARYRWEWRGMKLLVPVGVFLFVDLAFFLANISKIARGAWFPLAVAAVVFTLLTTWNRGRSILSEKLYSGNPTVLEFLLQISSDPSPTRVPGKAVYMAGSTRSIPPALLHNLKHNKILHSEIAIVTFVSEEEPTVPRNEKVGVEDLGQGFYRVVAHFGFMEEPNVPHVLALAAEKGLDFKLEEVSFFLGRESFVQARRPLMPAWRQRIFAFMSRNAVGVTPYFHLPPDQVVELGTQVKI